MKKFVKHVGRIQKGAAPILSEGLVDLIRFSAFLTAGTLLVSLAIGAIRGSVDAVLVALALAGVLILIDWVVTILFLAPFVIVGGIGRISEGRSSRSRSGAIVRNGLKDDWLDGPA